MSNGTKEGRNGDEVQDVVTGFKGSVTATASYITGCDQALVNPRIKKDGSYADGHWFDITRLKVVKKKTVSLVAKPETGGPQHTPDRR